MEHQIVNWPYGKLPVVNHFTIAHERHFQPFVHK